MSAYEQPRTAPPTDGVDRFERFSQRLEADDADVCPDCGSRSVDVWMTEGASAARAVCVCGHEWDDDEVLRLFDRVNGGGQA